MQSNKSSSVSRKNCSSIPFYDPLQVLDSIANPFRPLHLHCTFPANLDFCTCSSRYLFISLFTSNFTPSFALSANFFSSKNQKANVSAIYTQTSTCNYKKISTPRVLQPRKLPKHCLPGENYPNTKNFCFLRKVPKTINPACSDSDCFLENEHGINRFNYQKFKPFLQSGKIQGTNFFTNFFCIPI